MSQLKMNNVNDKILGMSRNEIFDELKALGLDPYISTIKELGADGYNELKSENIITEQLSKIKWHKVKDWSDYVLFHEKQVGNEKHGMNNINVIDLYYTVNSTPWPGDGYIYTTEKIKEQTLEQFLNNYIEQKYNSNPYIKLGKIKRI